MAALKHWVGLLVVTLLTTNLTEAVQLWESTEDIPSSVPARCRAALVRNITCEPFLITARQALSGRALPGGLADEYCTSSCEESIVVYREGVESACGKGPHQLWHDNLLEQSPWELAVGLSWAYDLSCIQDDTGYCLADLYNGTKEICSDCALQYGAVMVSTDFGRSKMSPRVFHQQLSDCGAPTESYTYSYTPPPSTSTASQTSSTEAPLPSCVGTTRIVAPGDTCASIAREESVGTDNMINQNRLDYNCHSLKDGMSLCIQDTCQLMEITSNMTCDDVLENEDFELVQLISWNPTIHSNCDNLDVMVNRSICISPPGGGEYSYDPPVQTNIGRPRLTNPMFSIWKPAVVHTEPIKFTTLWDAPPLSPSPTTSTVTLNETALSMVEERRVYCWITEEDEENGFHEEDLPASCEQLVDTYCYPDIEQPVPSSPSQIPAACTPDRVHYVTPSPASSSSPAPELSTPTPYQDNMIDGCQDFYLVMDGDGCWAIAERFGIALDAFYAYNPDVGEDCSGLWADVYVCVLV